MPLQRGLIGIHPILPNIFAKWLTSNDVPITVTKSYRSLASQISNNYNDLID